MAVAGEELPAAAARELAEEADLTAARWQLLVDLHSSPGYSNEVVRIYLARELAEVPAAERHQREHEEARLTSHRVPLDHAGPMVLRGEVTNASPAAGVLAAAPHRGAGGATPRPPPDGALPRREPS